MKTAFVAETAAAIRCRQYAEGQVVDDADAAAAWGWRMLSLLDFFIHLLKGDAKIRLVHTLHFLLRREMVQNLPTSLPPKFYLKGGKFMFLKLRITKIMDF